MRSLRLAFLAALVSAAALSTPEVAHAQSARRARAIRYDGGPVPNDMHVVRVRRRGTMTGGAVVLSVSYALTFVVRTALCAGNPCSAASGWLYAPGFGAIVYTAEAPNPVVAIAGFFAAVTENVGALLLLSGSLSTHAELRPNDDRVARTPWMLVPTGPAGSLGATFAIALP